MEAIVAEEVNRGHNGSIRRKYEGPIDLFKPTFYISDALGERPAELVRDLIGGDQRFFEPALDDAAEPGAEDDAGDHNYNENTALVDAIMAGARGAYWHILHNLHKE